MVATARLRSMIGEDASLGVVNKDFLMRLARSVEKRLIFHPDNLEILLPTKTAQIYNDLIRGNAIIVADKDTGDARAYAAYTDRLGPQLKKDLGLGEDILGMSELYCVVVDKEHFKGGMGIAIVQELILMRYKANEEDTVQDLIQMRHKANDEAGIKEFTAFITFQEQVVAFARRAADVLRREHGMQTDIRVFAGRELPMLSQFLTFVHPQYYTPEEIARINGTNPAWDVKQEVLNATNKYLSGGSLTRFSLDNTSVIFLSNAAEAYRTEAALSERFKSVLDLQNELLRIGYTI